MSDDVEFNNIRKALQKAGWRIVRAGGHYKGYPPDKNMKMVAWPTTPGRGRALANFKAQLKRSGFNA